MTRYVKPETTRDLREQGRIILAHGELTGHAHQVCATETETGLPVAEFFEEPDGRRVLLALGPCVLRHQEHAPIALDPLAPIQFRQGDVYGLPIGRGAWEIRRQVEYSPEAIRQVAD